MGDAYAGSEQGSREIRVLSPWLAWAMDPEPPIYLYVIVMATITALMATVSWYFASPPFWLGLLLVLLLGLLVAIARCRLGWLLNSEGLQELRLSGRRAKVPWRDLSAVDETPMALLVHTRQGMVRIPWQMRGARLMATAVREHLRPSRAPREGVEPSQIQAWLGIRESEVLPLGRPTVARAALAAVGLTLLGSLLWLGLRFERRALFGGAFALLIPFLNLALTQRRWQVGCDGFRIGEQYILWSDLVLIRRARYGWLVETTTVPIRLTGQHAARVAKVVEQVLAEQPPPVVAPGRMEASDLALSRAETPDEAAERGLSTLR